MPVALYDVKSKGSEAYLALAREFLERDAARGGRKSATIEDGNVKAEA
jgi:hypothetical protein